MVVLTAVLPLPVNTVSTPTVWEAVPRLKLLAPLRATCSTLETLLNWDSLMVPAVLNTSVSRPAPP